MGKEAREMTYTITPDQVYSPVPIAPVGYEIIAFRPPKIDETFLNAIGGCILAMATRDFSWISPRFILRPIVPQRYVLPQRYVFEETGEVRPPHEGEFYVSPRGGITRAAGDYNGPAVYMIVRPIEK